MTQCEAILSYMDRNGSITQAEADRLHIKRLASRICELRQKGHKIEIEWLTGKNEYGPWRCAKYRRA